VTTPTLSTLRLLYGVEGSRRTRRCTWPRAHRCCEGSRSAPGPPSTSGCSRWSPALATPALGSPRVGSPAPRPVWQTALRRLAAIAKPRSVDRLFRSSPTASSSARIGQAPERISVSDVHTPHADGATASETIQKCSASREETCRPATLGASWPDDLERSRLSDLLDELGPQAPTLLQQWTARDPAAHLALREHDFLAALVSPCLVGGASWHSGGSRR